MPPLENPQPQSGRQAETGTSPYAWDSSDPRDQPPTANWADDMEGIYGMSKRTIDNTVRISGTVNFKGNEMSASGSGFFVNQNGEIATDFHVIDGLKDMKVEIRGRQYQGEVTVEATDPAHDLALLKLSKAPENITALPLEPAANLNQGDSVLAFGYRLGNPSVVFSPVTYEGQTKMGVLDLYAPALMDQGRDPNESLLITKGPGLAHPDHGDSGGPVLDQKGNVVGLVVIGDSISLAWITPVEQLNALIARTRATYKPTSPPRIGTSLFDSLNPSCGSTTFSQRLQQALGDSASCSTKPSK